MKYKLIIDKNADENAYKQAQLEFGDVLFAMVNVARRMGLDSEAALRASCAKFRSRWLFSCATA